GSGRRAAGIAVTAGGSVACSAGTVFGVRAFTLASESNDGCKADGSCTPAGLDAWKRGRTAASLSNGFFTAGGIVGAAGAALVVVAVMERQRPRAATTAARLQIAPVIGPGTGSLSLGGVW